jgi:hypothetical protein
MVSLIGCRSEGLGKPTLLEDSDISAASKASQSSVLLAPIKPLFKRRSVERKRPLSIASGLHSLAVPQTESPNSRRQRTLHAFLRVPCSSEDESAEELAEENLERDVRASRIVDPDHDTMLMEIERLYSAPRTPPTRYYLRNPPSSSALF